MDLATALRNRPSAGEVERQRFIALFGVDPMDIGAQAEISDLDLVATPRPGAPPHAPAHDSVSYSGEMRSANHPAADGVAQQFGPEIGAATSPVFEAADAVTQNPFVEGGGDALERAAMFAIPSAAGPAVKATASVGSKAAPRLADALKAGVKKVSDLGETRGYRLGDAAYDTAVNPRTFAPVVGATGGITAAEDQLSGRKQYGQTFGEALPNVLTTAAMLRAGMTGAGMAPGAAKKGLEKAKAFADGQTDDVARQMRLDDGLTPNDAMPQMGGALQRQTPIRPEGHFKTDLPEEFPTEAIRAAPNPKLAEQRHMDRVNLEEAIKNKKPFKRSRDQFGRFVSHDQDVILHRAAEEVAMKGTLSPGMRGQLKMFGVDLDDADQPWSDLLARTLREAP